MKPFFIVADPANAPQCGKIPESFLPYERKKATVPAGEK
jgi:hypothetical protein